MGKHSMQRGRSRICGFIYIETTGRKVPGVGTTLTTHSIEIYRRRQIMTRGGRWNLWCSSTASSSIVTMERTSSSSTTAQSGCKEDRDREG